MVDVELSRFPWSFEDVKLPPTGYPDAEPIHVGYRVCIDFLATMDVASPFNVSINHFTSQSDLLDNYQLALDCGVSAHVGRFYLLVTPYHFSEIYNQIKTYVSQSNSY